MEIKDRQKKRIIDWVGRIGSAATDEDEKRIEEGIDSMRKGPVAAVWDKVLFLWNTFRTDCPAQQKALIIGALRDREHWSHFTFSQAVDAAAQIGAETVYFTHMNHETSHADIERRFQGIAAPAYDTLVLEVDDE